MTLLDDGQALAGEVALWLQAIDDPEMPLAEMGTLSLELAHDLRGLAILVLLAKGDVDKFHHNLIRSGRVRLLYLERVHREAAGSEHNFVSGCVGPLLDAVAAGDGVLAQRIAALSPTDWRQGHEYEDDFCCAQIWHQLLDDATTLEDAVPWLTRLRAYQPVEMPSRAQVFDALLRRDQAAFDAAFEALLVDRANAIDENEAAGELESPAVIAQRKICIEALAVLRVAEGRGLHTARDHRFCPAPARQAMTSPVPDD